MPPDSEWLLTDGRGGYACGTAGDLPTRRYHGLWVTRPDGVARRQMIVAGLDERLAVPRRVGEDDAAVARDVTHLMHAHWRDLPAPSAPDLPVAFARRPLPTWTWGRGDGALSRTVALQREADGRPPCLVVRWHNRDDRARRLLVRPLLGWCDADHLPPADEAFDATVLARGASWGFRPTAQLPPLWLTVDGVAALRGDAVWYRGFLYATDRARGYDHVGDRWSPGVVELDLPAGGVVTAAFALDAPCEAPTEAFDAAEAAAAKAYSSACEAEAPDEARLALGADDFLYRAEGGRLGVLAGFPWFGEWGRDVFLALPGLTLARGDVARCAEVLTGCLPFLKGGLLPNVYGRDAADSAYASCDAALWFALAVQRFADAGHDAALVDERLVPALREIVAAYRRGTALGLEVDDDGLLRAGGPDLNATWMDAETSRGPVTPRDGLPVEIQALWYALLSFVCERDADDAELAALRDRCGKAFVRRFWLPDEKRLADRVVGDERDRSVRPNMLVAAALRRSPLSRVQREGVVRCAEAALLTPHGLRTLAPDDPRYVGVYRGGVEMRDAAYHQGTVWPWPAGFHVEAALRAAPKRARRKVAAEQRAWLDALLASELDRAGLDHVSEVFDGDPPHRPGGTFAQAWNTGELLRALALCRAADVPAAGAAPELP